MERTDTSLFFAKMNSASNSASWIDGKLFRPFIRAELPLHNHCSAEHLFIFDDFS